MDKFFYILSLGCQMNKNDSERIIGLLFNLGFKKTDKAEQADLIIVNTCSVRQAAEERVVGLIHNWQALRAAKPNLVIAITGCMPGRDKDGKIKKKLKGVDLFFAIESLPMLPGWLNDLGLKIDAPNYLADYFEINPQRENKASVFITIQTGCDNFCTYCVVPYARGREKNRPVKEILAEIKKVVSPSVGGNGKEIVLLGQVVNHYIAPDKESFSANNPFTKHVILSEAKDLQSLSSSPPVVVEGRLQWGSSRAEGGLPSEGVDDFAALLWEINQIPEDFRIHFTAADPQYFSDAQIQALTLPKQVNYLHLPVQSGDNEVLRKMNRKYTREQYIELIKKIRAAKPDIAIGTDIIVGFCDETEAQFENTVDLYKQCDFDISYHAMYSERSGTAAAKAFKDNVSREEKKRRWGVLQELMERIVLQRNQKFLGQTVRVLVDKCENGVCTGNSNELKLVEFPGTPELIGQFVSVKINFAEKWVLRGLKID